MKASRVRSLILLVAFLSVTACTTYGQKPQDKAPKITVTTVQKKAVAITEQYLCQVHSLRHIDVRTPVEGYVAEIPVGEGQVVKRDELLVQIRPRVDKEKLGTESEDKTVSIKAPFDGLVGRLPRQAGSFVLKGETLTTLSDNSLMRAEFNVPEARYLEYMSANSGPHRDDPKIELVLANGSPFHQPGKLGPIAAEFKAGNIAFRADFSNPNGQLRHGQTGTVSVTHVQKDAVVVPQLATFEVLDKRYVYTVDQDNVAHQREIFIQNESEGLFVIKKGVGVGDKIVLEGGRLVRDGSKVRY